MKRSILRVRDRAHIDPRRKDEVIIDVVRDGEVIAQIYGSLEGVHIISDRLNPDTNNKPFYMNPPPAPLPGYVVPLLAKGEKCPWCDDQGIVQLFLQGPEPCPVCKPNV